MSMADRIGDAIHIAQHQSLYIRQIAQLAQASAGVAGQYLNYYFKEFTGNDVPFQVDPLQVEGLINKAMLLVGDTWEPQVESTVTFVEKGLEKNNVQTCTAAFAFGKEEADAPAETVAPDRFSLDGNYPNPFNPSTTIRYGLPGHVHVVLDVFTIIGQKVAELVNADMEAGYHEVQFHGDKLGSGIYFYRLQAGSFVDVKKLVLCK